jgi:H+/Cl- antiporter ClcA
MSRLRHAFRSLARAFEAFRVRIAHAEALAQLSVLGVLCGIAAGLVILALRFAIEETQALILPGGQPENFEALPAAWRLLLPVGGGLLVGVILQRLPEAARSVGVVHVMERLSSHQGRLPLANALVQFFGATLCIASGQSVGREGPSVHLGAASGSLLGQWLKLPTNTLRVLAGCGTAAAIAAMFNTPLAGVIFAMEVVMMEYTLVGFAPVMLAAAAATTLSWFAYGAYPAFVVPPLSLGSPLEWPYVLFIGVALGTLAAVFIRLLRYFVTHGSRLPLPARTTLAGLVTGLCALAAPPIMGIGYDTVNAALLGELGAFALITIVGLKLLATTAGIGLGLPAGLIGPTLVLGATAGGALGHLGQWLAPVETSSVGFYALLGMGAMMAGTLHAPLAALTAMLELTGNLNIVPPGMVAVIAAVITCRQLFHEPSAFVMLLRARGLEDPHDPLTR